MHSVIETTTKKMLSLHRLPQNVKENQNVDDSVFIEPLFNCNDRMQK